MDEFRSDMAFRDALSLLQGYREDNQANARYQNKIILAKTIIVSTNISIDQQYSEIRMKHYEEWRAFYNRFNRGIWEIIYSEIDDKRYIACISSSKDYSPAARKSLDFSEPPVDINDGMIFVQSNEDFYIVKRLIRLKKSVTEEAIIKQKAKEEEERAESDKAIPWLKV